MKNIKERNWQFTYLQAIAIFLVVDSHVGLPINLMNSCMPYNSYYMPLFVFISGYFYTSKPFITFMHNKIKGLLLPYFAYHFFYWMLTTFMRKMRLVNWGGVTYILL